MAVPTSSITAKNEAMMEFSALGNPAHCPLGMYVTPYDDDIFSWSGVLFIHQGYYRSAVFHFILTIPSSYPSVAPTVSFLTDVFHPLVDPGTGKLSLASRFPTWRPRTDFIYNVLHFVKSTFKRAGLDGLREAQCLNKEAYRLYREQIALFAKLAAQSAMLSVTDSALYGLGARGVTGARSAIKFRKLEPGEEEALAEKVEQEARAGLVPRAEDQV